jgi:rRNA biogenesis protein RRP5
MDPHDLHANYSGSDIVESMVFTAAIESVEDHGYVIDLGIDGAHTFLSKDSARVYIKNANHNKPLGELTYGTGGWNISRRKG